MTAKKKLLLAAGIFVIMALLALIVVIIQKPQGAATLVIESVPSDLTLTLDGRRISANGTHYVEPGEHKLKAVRAGFADEEQTITVKKDEKRDVGIYLASNSQEGDQWYVDHPEQLQKAEGGASRQYDAVVEDVVEQNPILPLLPVIDRTFRIDYGLSQKDPEKKGSFALYIQAADEEGKANALDWIRYNNFDPATYEIIYSAP